jgi:Tol biopolymer transport system component
LPTGNGGRVFAFSDENETDAMNYSTDSAQFRPFLANTHVLDLALSKDGKWIAEIMPDKTLWRSKVDGTERAQLVGGPLYSNHPSWSPDGKSIAFEGRTPGHAPRAYAIRFDGGTIEDVIPDHDDAEQSTPVWSADGASIAVALNVTAVPGSNVPRGIFIADWKSRRSRMLPGSEGFTTPVWSPDGKYLTAKTYDERGLMLYDANRQKWTELASGTALSGRPLWSKDSKYLYIQDLLEPGEPVYRLRAGDFSRERFIDFRKVLNSGIEQCALEDLALDGSPVILLTRRGVRVYVLDLDLP